MDKMSLVCSVQEVELSLNLNFICSWIQLSYFPSSLALSFNSTTRRSCV